MWLFKIHFTGFYIANFIYNTDEHLPVSKTYWWSTKLAQRCRDLPIGTQFHPLALAAPALCIGGGGGGQMGANKICGCIM